MEVAPGQVVVYSIQEFTGDQRDTYFAKSASKWTTDSKGETVITDYKGTYSLLLSLTMYDADGKLVPESVIQGWPDATQKALAEAAKEVCNFKADEVEKKD